MSTKKKENLINYGILILITLVITMCNYIFINKSGYLSTDVAVWTNISKGMMQGKVMYNDLFDHKGPILYFIYYFGYLIGNQFGIYILDFIFNGITVFMIYSICKLLVKDKFKIYIILGICAIFMVNICNENPCTESIALAFTMIAFYQGIKFMLDSSSFRKKESFLTAICFSIVLLLRPNLLIFWVLFYINLFIKLIKQKKIKELMKIILYSILGTSIILLPIIIYFIKNNVFNNFINYYLLVNLKYSSVKEVDILQVIEYFVFRTYLIIPIICGIYIALMVTRKKLEEKEFKLLKFSFIYYLISFCLIIMPGRCYDHYVISMIPTFIIPLAIILKNIIKFKKIIYIILLLIVFLFISAFGNMQNYKNNFYFKMSIIEKEVENIVNLTKKEDNVLVLGNKTFLYLMLDRQYKGKYFYQLPIANENEEMAVKILVDIKENLPDYIINGMSLYKKQELTYFEKEMKTLLDEKYIKNGLIYEKVAN